MLTAKNLLLLGLSFSLVVLSTSCNKEEEEDDNGNDPIASNVFVGTYDGVEATEKTLVNGQITTNSSEDISSYVLAMKSDGTYEAKENGTPLLNGTYNATTKEADIDGAIYSLDLEGDNLYFTYQETTDSNQYEHQLYFLRQ